MFDEPLLLSRAEIYANRTGVRVFSTDALGRGMEGSVWPTSRGSAIKVIRSRKNYDDELECYRRLREAGVRELCGFAVPYLFDWDDDLMIIEMSIVQKPYLLDFGKVYLDGSQAKTYNARELASHRASAQSRYGASWPRVSILLHVLETRFGIYYADPRPSNIDCGESEKDDPDWDKEPGLDYSEYD